MSSLEEQLESVRREKKALEHDLKDVHDQLNDGGRSTAELAKMRRRLEIEKEELQVQKGKRVI